MTARKDLINLIEKGRKPGQLSTFLNDQVFNDFVEKHHLQGRDSRGEGQNYDIDKINELLDKKFNYERYKDQCGAWQNRFCPISVKKLTKADIDEALDVLKNMSVKNDFASYPPKNDGAVTDWKCFIGKTSIFAKGYFQGWQGKWLVFIKGYGWCDDVKCSISYDEIKSEIEPYPDLPRQVYISHGVAGS